MEVGLKHIFVITLILLFLFKKALANKNTWVYHNNHLLNVIFFLAIGIFLGVQFWADGFYIGIFALFLGTLAFGKYYYDVSNS